MACAIMGGLAIATVLTLVFLPTLYIVWFRIKEQQASAPPLDIADDLLEMLAPYRQTRKEPASRSARTASA